MVPGGRPTPGIDYNVPNGAMMIAAAPGWVSNVKELRTGRAGGIMVEVVHTPELYAIRGYISYYAHLAHPYVGEGQFVRRGDAIGVVTEHREYAKLLFMEGGHYGRWVDPDNYGRQHSYMDYWDGSDSKSDMSDLELIAARSKKQKAILKYFEDARADCRDDPLYDPVFAKVHGSNRAYWSVVEQYRYHECLYDIKPDIFPDVSKNECDALRKEFYENQPIVLTLPLTKPG
jgi:hypothetical protein